VRIQTLDCRYAETVQLVTALANDLTPYPVHRSQPCAQEQLQA